MRKILVTVLMMVFFSAAVASAGFDVSVSGNDVTFTVPLTRGQMNDMREKGHLEQKWQVYVSWSYYDGKWVLIPEPNYAIKTTQGGDKLLLAITSFPNVASDIFSPRVWFKDLKSGEWGWIDQHDPYCRNNIAGNPSYEAVINQVRTKGVSITPATDNMPVRP